MPQSEDTGLCQAAVEAGFVTQTQVQECLRLLSRLRQRDPHLTIGDLMVRRGYMTQAQLRRVQEKRPGRDPLVHTRVAQYEILERLGAGAMGVVYKALNIGLNRVSALKVLSEERVAEEGYLERFYREARAAGQLIHPNIVTIYHVGQADKHHFIEMEYVEGESIGGVLARESRVDAARCVAWTRQVAAALEAAHAHGIVHRDIKPDNILVGEDGTAKVADFGLAKSLADATRLTRPGQAVGTPLYMAPEQYDGSGPDRRSDFYSLGVSLYLMLTGRHPFRANNIPDLVHAHKHTQPTPVEELNPDVPAGLSHVVSKLLAKSPDDRYQSAQDVIADLDRVLAAQPEPSPLRVIRFPGGGRWEPVDLPEGMATIGRSSSNPIPLQDKRASRRHAQLIKDDTGLQLQDLGSTNGTRVNGERIDLVRLSPHDLVMIGTTLMLVLGPREPADRDETGRRATLAGTHGPVAGVRFEVTGRPIVVGRGEEADVRIEDPNVSEFHAHISACDKGIRIYDLGSQCGTRVNGQRIVRTLMQGPSMIEIASSRFTIELEPGAAPLIPSQPAPDLPEEQEVRVEPSAKDEASAAEEPPAPIPPGHAAARTRASPVPMTEQAAAADDSTGPPKPPSSISDIDLVKVLDDSDAGPGKREKMAVTDDLPEFDSDTHTPAADLRTVHAPTQRGPQEAGAQKSAITFVIGPLKGREFPLPEGVISLGRSPEADITIDDPLLSRKHAEIRREGGRIEVVDLQSVNGIEVNGERVSRKQLELGSSVRIGVSLFVLHTG